jgi:ribosomal protein S18 acetylase RimI-like enzyme
VIRELIAADTAETLRLLGERSLENLFLEYVVRSGAIGRVPGLFGSFDATRLGAVLMVGPLGGTSLAARTDGAWAPLARFAASLRVAPRHVVGPEDVTIPFLEAYAPLAPPVIWSRREPVYLLEHARVADAPIEVAAPGDLDEIVANSREQHREDLGDDRRRLDPKGFRCQHEADLRAARWRVLRHRGAIVFQAHVGARTERAVQVGGVFTPRAQRGRGWATRGLAALTRNLLERNAAVSLFCDESNAPARRLYAKLGFRAVSYYRSFMLERSPQSAVAAR